MTSAPTRNCRSSESLSKVKIQYGSNANFHKLPIYIKNVAVVLQYRATPELLRFQVRSGYCAKEVAIPKFTVALVNTGTAQYNLSAMFNTDNNVPGAIASVLLNFYNSPVWVTGDMGGNVSASLTLDNNASTWESVSKAGYIPVGTTWMLAQVAYNDASLSGGAGFVDGANLSVSSVPLPAGVWLLGSALLGLAGVARRKAV